MAPTTHALGLIDTDILVDATRGLVDAVTFLAAQQAAAGVQVSVISAMELIAGCRNAVELVQVQQFLNRVTVLPITSCILQTAYQLMQTFYLSHGLLIPDSLIAATALESGLTLFTKNTRHFQMIPGLNVLRPY